VAAETALKQGDVQVLRRACKNRYGQLPTD